MAYSVVFIEDIGAVKIVRRKGLKYLRITIARDGAIRLSLPWYVPKKVGLEYIKSKKDWIKQHAPQQPKGWHGGQQLTKDYVLKLNYTNGKKATSRINNDSLEISIPVSYNSAQRKQSLDRNIKKFLQAQSEEKIIPLVNEMAQHHGFKVRSIRIKHLKSRWGSCDHEKNITLSSNLITLDDKLIRYVIYHELSHTKHLDHSRAFWQEVERLTPDYKELRKVLRKS